MSVHWPAARNEERPSSRRPRMNRLSTARQPRFVFLHSVYIGFRLFALPKRRSGQLSSMPWKPWRAMGTVASWANRPVGVQSCPAPLRPAAPPCASPPRPARGMSGLWIRQVANKFQVVSQVPANPASRHFWIVGNFVSVRTVWGSNQTIKHCFGIHIPADSWTCTE